VDIAIELRQLRYFVAVAEELHFGRAAERLHMSQSPLSRAIRELERDLGVVLFVRTTRRVELTPAGLVLLERSRRALAEIDGAIADARRSAVSDDRALGIGYGPFSGSVVARIAQAVEADQPQLGLRLVEEVTPDSLRRVGAHQLAAAVVMESPAAARRHGVRTMRSRTSGCWPRFHSRTGTPARPRSRSVSSPRSAFCSRVSRPARCSTPGCGRCFVLAGSSSTGR
jgi:DNA-binding transcriptional LysR family regulator